MLLYNSAVSGNCYKARLLFAHLGIEYEIHDIAATLEAIGCYRWRDEAIRRVFPEYDAATGYKSKIGLPQNLLDADTLNVFYLTVVMPDVYWAETTAGVSAATAPAVSRPPALMEAWGTLTAHS